MPGDKSQGALSIDHAVKQQDSNDISEVVEHPTLRL